jgi:hypothetical protein
MFLGAIQISIHVGQLDSLEILSHAGFPVHPFVWFYACGSNMEGEVSENLLQTMID